MVRRYADINIIFSGNGYRLIGIYLFLVFYVNRCIHSFFMLSYCSVLAFVKIPLLIIAYNFNILFVISYGIVYNIICVFILF